MDFATAYTQSGLEAALPVKSELSPNGRAPLTKEAVDLAIAISKVEPISPHLICFTHLCENSFQIIPAKPNTNGHPEAIWRDEKTSWDIGPFQINLGWALRMVFNSELHSGSLRFTECMGTKFFEDDGVTPAAFTGLPLANGRLAARRLVVPRGWSGSGADRDRFYAVKYTGPLRQERRGGLWDLLHSNFENFFRLYMEG